MNQLQIVNRGGYRIGLTCVVGEGLSYGTVQITDAPKLPSKRAHLLYLQVAAYRSLGGALSAPSCCTLTIT